MAFFRFRIVPIKLPRWSTSKRGIVGILNLGAAKMARASTPRMDRYSYAELKRAQTQCAEKAVGAALEACGATSDAQKEVFKAHVNDLCASVFTAVLRQYDPVSKGAEEERVAGFTSPSLSEDMHRKHGARRRSTRGARPRDGGSAQGKGKGGPRIAGESAAARGRQDPRTALPCAQAVVRRHARVRTHLSAFLADWVRTEVDLHCG
jgi:hypothetical protein